MMWFFMWTSLEMIAFDAQRYLPPFSFPMTITTCCVRLWKRRILNSKFSPMRRGVKSATTLTFEEDWSLSTLRFAGNTNDGAYKWGFVDQHISILRPHRCGAEFEVRLLSIQVSVSTWKEIVTNSTVLISRSPLNHQRCDILVTFAMERIQHSDRKGFGFSVCSQRMSDKWLLQGDFNRRRD